MFLRSHRFGKFGDYGYIGKLGQADWFYGGKPAAEFNPCKPGQTKEEWGGGIRCVDPSMMPKTSPEPPANDQGQQAPPEKLPPGVAPAPGGPTPLSPVDALNIIEEEYGMAELLPYIIGAGIVLILIWILIIKL